VASVALGILFWRVGSPSPEGASSQVSASKFQGAPARDLVRNTLLQLDVEPDHAEIWLDGKRLATGHVSQLLARDGQTHEIRLSAPGYIPLTLVFADTAPQQRVALERMTSAPTDDEGSPRNGDNTRVSSPHASPARAPDPRVFRGRAENAPPKHAIVAGAGASRTRATVADANQAARSQDGNPAAPRIQIVDPTNPKVQIIEGAEPRIQIIEPPKPKVQIIDPLQPKPAPREAPSASIPIID
jgi:hypothetical protein